VTIENSCKMFYYYNIQPNSPSVLCGHETWSLTLREEHNRLSVFVNRVLRIFRPERDEVTGEWRKLHNEELYNLYTSTNIIK
jgi:hypothetical protein